MSEHDCEHFGRPCKLPELPDQENIHVVCGCCGRQVREHMAHKCDTCEDMLCSNCYVLTENNDVVCQNCLEEGTSENAENE